MASTEEWERGLTEAQVASRVAAGLSNANADVPTKTVAQIVASHALTLFNAVNLALAALVALTGEYRNLTFMGVVVINLVVGVVQEVRAKRMVDRLTILTARDVTVMREGVERRIGVEQVVTDDIVLLAHGDQVPADGVVLRGRPLVDESLLTGESDSIEKRVGDELFSGSHLVAGDVAYRVVRVGCAGYAAQINAEARYVKPVTSEILRTLRMIIGFATVALIPLGLGLFLRSYLMDGTTTQDAILSTVAAVVGMIPQGLVLLTSGVLAIATTRLGARGVLVQQAYCVETLARVDTLCLDKTGTITSGAMEVTSVVAAPGHDEAEVELAFVTVAQANAADANETALALMAHAERRGIFPERVARSVAFTSARKMSACLTEGGRALAIGAAQFLLGPDAAAWRGALEAFGAMERVLTVVEADGLSDGDELVGEVRVLGFVALRDEIRPTAAQTIDYFKGQGVALKVISGDDPRTVSAIAQAVGIEGAASYVDASALPDDDAVVAAASGGATVFGRVTPQQKRTLVRALRADGHTVAMTGDGVNDVLALKEADCSVCMAAGSAAARNVSEIVLVDNDFAHMPEVVAEGRRSINNLQRSASLFLVKTVFSALLALVCVFLPPYPFIPIQMTLLSSSVIGWPSFALSLEPNHERVTGDFLANVLRRSLPASAAIVCALVAVQAVERPLGLSFAESSTLSLYLSAIVGVALVLRASWPLTPVRGVLLVSVVAMLLVGCLGFPAFFHLAPLTVKTALFLVACGALALALFHMLYVRLSGEGRAADALLRATRHLEAAYDRRHHADAPNTGR